MAAPHDAATKQTVVLNAVDRDCRGERLALDHDLPPWIPARAVRPRSGAPGNVTVAEGLRSSSPLSTAAFIAVANVLWIRRMPDSESGPRR